MSDIIEPRRRGPYSRAFKAQIVEQWRQSGASVAEVAVRHGLREALVYRWLAQDTVEAGSGTPAANVSGRPAFIPFEPVSPNAGEHPAFAALDAQTMIRNGLSAPLHERAERYYRERDWVR